MKRCTKCGKMKPPSMFYRRERSADGRMNVCAVCTNRQAAARVQKLKAEQHQDGWGPLPDKPLLRWQELRRRTGIIRAQNAERQGALQHVQEEEPSLDDQDGP